MTKEGELAIDLMMRLEVAQLSKMTEDELLIEVAKIVSDWRDA